MFSVNLQNVQFVFAGLVGLVGFVSTILGLYMLVVRGYSHEMKVLAAESAHLGQKGISDSVTALVETSAQLVEAINHLVRTAAGIGVFLATMGLAMLAGSYYMLLRLSFLR